MSYLYKTYSLHLDDVNGTESNIQYAYNMFFTKGDLSSTQGSKTNLYIMSCSPIGT